MLLINTLHIMLDKFTQQISSRVIKITFKLFHRTNRAEIIVYNKTRKKLCITFNEIYYINSGWHNYKV